MSDKLAAVQRSERDWYKLYTEHLSSGQSSASFCRERGIAESSYNKWRRRFTELEVERKGVSKFKEVESVVFSGCQELEVELPAGVKLRFKY